MFGNIISYLKGFTRSLSFKLSFYVGLAVFLAIIAFAYRSISVQERQLIGKIIEESSRDSEVIKAAIWNGMMTKDREVIKQIVNTIGANEGFKDINIYDHAGKLHYSSRNVDDGTVSAHANPLLTNLANETSVRHRFSDTGKSLYVLNPLLNETGCSTLQCHDKAQMVLGALEVKVPLDRIKSEIYENTKQTIIFGFLLFILVSSVSGLAVIFFIIPSIKKLQDKAAKMAKGEYAPELNMQGSDEMSQLLRAFEEMSQEINQRTTELDASRKLYKSLFEEVPCYLTVIDRDYKIVNANNAFKEEFGHTLGKHCFEGYKGLSAKCLSCPVEKTFLHRASHQSEEIWTRNGKQIHVIVKTSPILGEDGSVAEVLEMSVDVTRLKELQFELQKKQSEYKYLFEHVPCYLTVVDPDFNIIQTNESFDQDFGSSENKKCYQIYKGLDSPCDDCPVVKTFQDGKSHSSEEIWRRSGQETCVIVNTAPVTDSSGKISAVMEMSTNVTELKRLQSELVILGETIAGMSHTIKNIVAGLQGGVYVVDSGLERGKDDRIRSGWTMVKSNVEKISELVKGILYASKEREPEYKHTDPGILLSEVCDLYRQKAADQKTSLLRSFKPVMGLCRLDPAGVHSAVANLISNALEACHEENGREHVVTVAARIESGRLIINVSDDGRGMPKEVKSQLFNKFYSTKGNRGTGLGLVVTRKVIEEHGGTIRVESEPGEGTTFIMEIPVGEVVTPEVSIETPRSAAV